MHEKMHAQLKHYCYVISHNITQYYTTLHNIHDAMMSYVIGTNYWANYVITECYVIEPIMNAHYIMFKLGIMQQTT